MRMTLAEMGQALAASDKNVARGFGYIARLRIRPRASSCERHTTRDERREEVIDQGCLADAGITADQHDPALWIATHNQVVEPSELRGTPHERSLAMCPQVGRQIRLCAGQFACGVRLREAGEVNEVSNEAEATAMNGFDIAWPLGIVLQRAAELGHGNARHRVTHRSPCPYGIQDIVFGQQAAWVGHQQAKDLPGLRPEVHARAVQPQPTTAWIYAERPKGDGFLWDSFDRRSTLKTHGVDSCEAYTKPIRDFRDSTAAAGLFTLA